MPKEFSFGVYDRKHLRSLSARLRKVQALLDEAAGRGAAIGSRTGYKDTDRDFSFDDFPAAKREIDALIRELSRSLTVNVQASNGESWGISNRKNDALADHMIASGGSKIARKAVRQWYNKNERALSAFNRRVAAGMDLSTDVWRLDLFKKELELSLEMGLGMGRSAAELSRDVRSYLRYPDKLFRRVRDEKGVLRLSRAARDFHPGRGVYRSSYKNALRLTATETNMAYRSADSMRWKQMGFVLGIEVRVSPTNHPVTDICDELQGDYPKDFVFTGWHPFCKCFATPKLPDPDAFIEYQNAMLSGEDVSDWQFGGEVDDVPDNFKGWMDDNRERINSAKSLPYFIKENPTYSGLGTKLTPIEIAEARHAARTEAQIADIRNRARIRHNTMRSAETLMDDFADMPGFDTSALRTAYEHGDWTAARQEALLLAQEKRSILEEAITLRKQLDGIKDVDTLQADLGSKLSSLNAAVADLRAKKKLLDSLTLLDDPVAAAKATSLADAVAVNAAVEKKLQQWATLPLEGQKKKLNFEINEYLGTDKYGAQTKYPNTWKVSQAAYMKKLEQVKDAIEWEDVNTAFKDLSAFKTKSKVYKDGIAQLQGAIQSKDKKLAESLTSTLTVKRQQLEDITNKRRAGKTTSVRFGDEAYTQKRKDGAVWCKDSMLSYNELGSQSASVWKTATAAEKEAIYAYTYEYNNINEPLRGLAYIGSPEKTKRGLDRISHITSLLERTSLKNDMWFQRGDDLVALKKFGLTNYGYASDADIKALVGKTGTEGAFLSTGASKGGGFSSKPVIFNIYAPKTTKGMYCEPFSQFGNGSMSASWDGSLTQNTVGHENEFLFQRGTKFKVTKVEKSHGKWYIDLDVIEQEPVQFPYVGGYPYS